ncbi:MAG: redoxin domain-containing protein [Bacteroidota bacterium]|nr:redoxin domain-containing protein [Bacteroidota bacterium]MDP3144023.1 redoxin domain-containing protein [Bacteroidota bacterium]MDP3557481.1 redoxin domain-containing protein [Bacteroidota bacterium]
MSPELNHKAPDFKLFNTEKKETTLSEQKGKNVVLLFFPLAFTSTCTAELCSIRDNYAIYNDLNAVVFGISVDTLFTLGKYKEEQKLNFDLLSDFNKNVSSAYGCLYDEFIFGMKGVSKRSAFVIDKDGLLKYSEILEKASDLPNFEAIKSCLEKLT